MRLKETVKSILLEKNPLVKRRIRAMQSGIKNDTMTFLCPNCIGGILFHDLGLKFQSPTVNLMMLQTDFLKFVMNLDYYLSLEFEFYTHTEHVFPCARLGDIDVHFTHYHSQKEALLKWEDRVKRIDKDNMFVFIEERDGLTKEDILSLKNLPVRGVVAFTAHHYPDIPYAVHIKKYENEGEVGNILARSYVDGSREYEAYFDFVKWFNEANGQDFAVKEFCKK